MVIGDKTYRVSGKYVKSRNDQNKTQNEYMLMLYFIDITEKFGIKTKISRYTFMCGNNYDR